MDDPQAGYELAGKGETRDRILRSAHDLFSRLGFSRVSMRQVATRAGVTKPALYYHFRDKETLFEECLADFNAELESTMRQAAGRPGSAAERVLAVAETLLTGSPFHPVRVHEELVDQASGTLRQRLRGIFATVVVAPVVDMFTELEARGELRPGVRPADAAAMLIGTCMAFLPRGAGEEAEDGWTPLPVSARLDVSRVAAETVAGMVLHGVAGP